MYKSIFILALLFTQMVPAQTPPSNYNLNLEETLQGGPLPDGFITWGDDLTHLSPTAQSGKQSVLIDNSAGEGEFSCTVTQIPGGFQAESLTLKGYIKTEGIEDGYTGLIVRINSEAGLLAIDNSKGKGLRGTHDWTQFELTIPYPDPEEVAFIYVGGILEGKGKAWFDNFTLTLDGKPIEDLKRMKLEEFEASQDSEFDAGSGISWKTVSESRSEDLYVLGKVWGFLKYHHPKIAKGKLNWDYELFRMLHKLETNPLEDVLIQTLDQLGPPSKSQKRKLPKGEIKLRPENEWLKDKSLLSPALSQRLVAIEKGKKEKKHYYIGFYPFVGNPKFKNEAVYTDMQWDDTGMRLLSLFRFWNMVEYFFPNRHLMDESWDEALRAHIPSMVSASTELEYKLCLIQVIRRVQDTHANVWGKEQVLIDFWGKNSLPAYVRFVENRALVTSLPDSLPDDFPLQIGDEILEFDGVAIDQRIREVKPYCTASNEPTMMRNVGRKLIRTGKEKVAIKVNRSTGILDLETPTWPYSDLYKNKPSPGTHRDLENNIGYMYPEALERGQGKDVMAEFMDKKGVVIDMRCYPGDFLPFSLVGNLLMPQPGRFVKFTSGSKSHPGAFTCSDGPKIGKRNNDEAYKGKIVVIVDDRTQSSAEYQTMAFRAVPGTVVIGSQTSGADGNVSSIYLPGNVFTYISGIGILTPEGEETQRIGIVPDIKVKPTVAGIRAGRDELLEKAIEIIQEAN